MNTWALKQLARSMKRNIWFPLMGTLIFCGRPVMAEFKANYGENVAFEKGRPVAFPDFSVTYVRSEERTFDVGGTTRSNSTMFFDVHFRDATRKPVELQWNYGFPGELAEGLGQIAVTRRKYFSIYLPSYSDTGGELKVVPNKEIVEPGKKKGDWILRKQADYGQELSFSNNSVLAFPDFDLSFKEIQKTATLLTEAQKKKAFETARSYYKDHQIDFTDDLKKSLQKALNEMVDSIILFQLLEGPDVETAPINFYMKKGEASFRGKKYSIDITSSLFDPGSPNLMDGQKIVVREEK